MKQSPWAANNATDGKELFENPKVHIHVHNSSNVHTVLIQDNAVPTVTKVYTIFTLTRSSRPDSGQQNDLLSVLKSCTCDYITHTCSPLPFHANYIHRPPHTPCMYHHTISMVEHNRLLNYLKVVELRQPCGFSACLNIPQKQLELVHARTQLLNPWYARWATLIKNRNTKI